MPLLKRLIKDRENISGCVTLVFHQGDGNGNCVESYKHIFVKKKFILFLFSL